jgi:hypothetical protein
MKRVLFSAIPLFFVFIHSCGAAPEHFDHAKVLLTPDYGILHPYDLELALSARENWNGLSDEQLDIQFTWQCYDANDLHIVPYDAHPPTTLDPGDVYLTGVAIIIPNLEMTNILIHSNRTSQLPPNETELNSVKKFLSLDSHFCVRAQRWGVEDADSALTTEWGRIPSKRYELWNYRALRNHAGVWNHFYNENEGYEQRGIQTHDFYGD